MARMSIDDKMRKDPRVLRLARSCGWSRRETMGCLIDVWAVCYDRISEVLLPIDIDFAAELEGFAEKLIESGLGSRTKRGVRVAGAKERIKYLKGQKESGRRGGLKSGETRRNSSKRPLKARLSDPSEESNPPDLVPDPVPDLDLSTSPERERPDALSGLPDGWSPEPSKVEASKSIAESKGLDVANELAKFIAYAQARNWKRFDWTSAFVKWLLDAKPAKDAEQVNASRRAQLRLVEEKRPPPAVAPMTAEEIAEMTRMATAIAANADVAARALTDLAHDDSVKRFALLEIDGQEPTEKYERREGGSRGVQDTNPRDEAKEATG